MRTRTHQFVAGTLVAGAAIVATPALPTVADLGPNVEQTDIVLPTPLDQGAERFGRNTLVLSNGNYVVSDIRYDDPQLSTSNVGLVVLYDGTTDEPISFVTGSTANDQIGSGGLYEVGSSDVAIVSQNATVNGAAGAGAVTWMDGTAGFGQATEVVSATNSIVGTTANDAVGDVTVLSTGDYVIGARNWDVPASSPDVGAARFVDGDVGASGPITDQNSIIGTIATDQIGQKVVELGNGNYVVASEEMTWPDDTFPQFDRNRAGGAVIAESDGSTTGRFGIGGTLNGYRGGQSGSRIGQTVIPVPGNANGDFVIGSTAMNHVLNGNSASNSGGFRKVPGTPVVASTTVLNATNTVWGRGDRLGSAGVEVLADGTFWLFSPDYFGPPAFQSGQRGAVTKVPPTQTYPMQVTEQNSVVGGPFQGNNSNSFRLGQTFAVLDNGNVVAGAPNADTNGLTNNGMFVWIDGSGTPAGEVTDPSSFSPVYGHANNDDVGSWIGAIGDGNYVTQQSRYDVGSITDAGAIYWGDGSQAIPANTVLDASNSIVGSSISNFVGNGEKLMLSSGDMLISTPSWNNPANSSFGAILLLESDQRRVGAINGLDKITLSESGLLGSGGMFELADGNVIIQSPGWDDPNTTATSVSDGLVTWIDPTQPVDLEADRSNSLIGNDGDELGDTSPFLFANGDFVVMSLSYDDPATSAPDDGYAVLVPGGEAATGSPQPGRDAGVGTGDGSGGRLQGFSSVDSFTNTFPTTPYSMTGDRGVVIDTSQNRAIILKLDDLPEFVGLPADVNAITATSSSTSVAVAFADPATSDDRDGTAIVNCSPASGSTFSVGTTAVTCSATDSNGNEALSTVSFDVIVAQGTGAGTDDLEAPDIVPIVPARLVDTRSAGSTVDDDFEADGQVGAGQTYEFQVAGRGGVPTTAVAATLNVVAVRPSAQSFLTMYPCDQPRPLASGLNSLGNDTRANELLAKVDADGKVCVYTLRRTDLVVDVTSYVPDGSDIVPVAPARLVETRTGDGLETIDRNTEGDGRLTAGQTYEFQVTGRGGVPSANVDAAVLNVTAIGVTERGFFTLHPCDEPRPLASGLNYGAAGTDVRANEQVTKVDANGKVCIYTLRAAHLVVDVNGYVNGSADLVAITPERFVETRAGDANETVDGDFEGDGRLDPGETLRLDVAGRGSVPSDATAVTLNVAAINPSGSGFATIFPCDAVRPLASSLNYRPDQVVANEVVAKIGADGDVCIYTLRDTHLIADVTSFVVAP